MKVLAEKEAEDFLETQGFNVVKRQFITKEKEEIKIKFPLVMKVSSKKIIHKAKIKGVIKNIKNQEKFKKSFKKLMKIKDSKAVILQETIKGEELIIGIKNTPEFAQVIMFGKGGSKVEQEKDISFRILPINKKDIEEMIQEVKYYKKIKNKVNIKELNNLLLKISNLIKKYSNIEELDINPLIINKKQAIIVDARIILK